MSENIIPPPQESKVAWRSKTIWIAAITAIAGFFPPFQQWMIENPEMVTMTIGLVFGLLRAISKGKIDIK